MSLFRLCLAIISSAAPALYKGFKGIQSGPGLCSPIEQRDSSWQIQFCGLSISRRSPFVRLAGGLRRLPLWLLRGYCPVGTGARSIWPGGLSASGFSVSLGTFAGEVLLGFLFLRPFRPAGHPRYGFFIGYFMLNVNKKITWKAIFMQNDYSNL